MSLNLISLFQLYLFATFLLSIYVRYRQYRDLAALILSTPERWPRLLALIHKHRSVLFPNKTLIPTVLTFSLMAAHAVLYYMILPEAETTPDKLVHTWYLGLPTLILGLLMLYLDYDAIFNVWKVDRQQIEQQLDQAEYWLGSWVSPVIRFFTLGRIDPRRMVSDQVLKALTQASMDLHRMMWRWGGQIAVRIGFALGLWLTWVFA
ncbi:MAG: hypothetical protein C4297_10795 [Gemmataceae bacterium]